MIWLLLLPFLNSETCLTKTGATHILVNKRLLSHYITRGLRPEDIRWGEFSRFERRCLTLVTMLPDGPLYRISPSTAARDWPARVATAARDASRDR